MGDIYLDFVDFMSRPAVVETLIDILLCAVPIWVAVMIGLVIGWSWRPRWTGLLFLGMRGKFRFLWTAPPGLGARRLWLAFTALSAFSVCRKLWSSFKGKGEGSAAAEDSASRPPVSLSSTESDVGGSLSGAFEDGHDVVTEKDLEHLLHLLDDGKVGDAVWRNQMKRSTPDMIYQAWRCEPEGGPIIYRSRTVFEGATPELVRDFFWDDDFRLKWDPMLVYSKTLEEFRQSGTKIVHWIKKFPFLYDREYIIGQRIWESGKTYYCVTKGVPYPSLCKNEKPGHVELYFSSWRIRAVESRKQDAQLSACEVTLIHYEGMGIWKDVAKVGVRHRMWGAVEKLQSGMRTYQVMRKTDMTLSRSALMARITTKIPVDGTIGLLDPEPSSESEAGNNDDAQEVHRGIDWKWVVIGGTVAVVCGLQTGLIGKALLFGAARRIARK